MSKLAKTSTQRLVLVLGEQLSLSNPAIAQADKARDLIVMAEVAQESTHVWSHKARTALFLSAMRHFAQTLLAAGYRLEYFTLGTHAFNTLAEVWGHALSRHQPEVVVACEPGDWRVEQTLVSVCADAKLPLTLLPDTHFMISREAFAEWAGGNAAKTKQLRMELFYRTMRKRTNVLMRDDGSPEGEVWNFDAENRGSFGTCPSRSSFHLMPSHVMCLPRLSAPCRTIQDHSNTLHGPLSATTPYVRLTHLFAITFLPSANFRTPCGRMSHSFITVYSPPHST
jgi:deoxyribodipyrimidine photolyase-like uncharacterized protein